eukprot:361860-Chlamydomonas_euryale.AAC.3
MQATYLVSAGVIREWRLQVVGARQRPTRQCDVSSHNSHRMPRLVTAQGSAKQKDTWHACVDRHVSHAPTVDVTPMCCEAPNMGVTSTVGVTSTPCPTTQSGAPRGIIA